MTMTTELSLEQRFERLLEKYRTLRQQYELTRKVLDDKMTEKPAERSSFSSFFSSIHTPEPNEVLKEELEHKISENERLVMDLSDVRRDLESTKHQISHLREKTLVSESQISDLQNALDLRVSSEQRLREEYRDLSERRAKLLEENCGLKTALERKDSEIASLSEEITKVRNECEKFQNQISDLKAAEKSQAAADLERRLHEFAESQEISVDEFTRQKVTQLKAQSDFLNEKNRQLVEELSRAAALVARERIAKEEATQNFRNSEISRSRLAEEFETTRRAYEQQMDILTESLAATRAQVDEIEQLKNACSHCGTVARCHHAICAECHGGGFLSRTFFQ